jgi:hypothetical protein
MLGLMILLDLIDDVLIPSTIFQEETETVNSNLRLK